MNSHIHDISHLNNDFYTNHLGINSILQSKEDIINRTFHANKLDASMTNLTSPHDKVGIALVSAEDSLIVRKKKDIDIQKWIDRKIDSNLNLYDLKTNNSNGALNTHFEAYFNAKFHNKNPTPLSNGKRRNKNSYKKRNEIKHLESVSKILNQNNAAMDSISDKHDFFDDNEKNSNFEHESLHEPTKISSNLETKDDKDNNECPNWKKLSTNFCDYPVGFSVDDLGIFNKSCKKKPLLSNSKFLSNNHKKHEIIETSDLNRIKADDFFNPTNKHYSKEAKIGPIHVKNKVKFAKKFFCNSISSVQPFVQDNLVGSIRQPCLKVDQLCVADDYDISSSISSKSSLNPTLPHKALKTTFKKPKKSKNVIMNKKSTNSKFIGFEELPKAAKTYFEKICERNTQRLLSYEKDETTTPHLKPIKSTKILEKMYDLDHDSQDETEKGETVDVSRTPVNENLSLKQFQEKESISQLLSEVNNTHEAKPKPRQKSHKDKILRNMKLGADARYFKLTEDQEALVEQILAQPDVDNILNEERSVASCASTGYDFDDEDAKRIAQINVELDQLQHQVHNSIISPRGESSRVPSVSTKQGIDTARTGKCSKQSTNKFHDIMSCSNSANTSDTRVKHYLEEQRERREGQERIEQINRTLKELEGMEFPKLTAEELEALILQCKYEQGILSTDTSESTIQKEHDLVPKSLRQCDPLVIKFQDHLRVKASGTVHLNQHNAASPGVNDLATTSHVQVQPRVSAPA